MKIWWRLSVYGVISIFIGGGIIIEGFTMVGLVSIIICVVIIEGSCRLGKYIY